MVNIHKKRKFLILGFIILAGLFFRTYRIVDNLSFAHDGDLYSWIVKDIIVDKHLRLIGQLTTAPGIYIGGLFYYLLVPFFALFNMDPVGTVVPIIILAVLTILSYYYVFTKLFSFEVGLIGAFLQAVLISAVNFDREVLPTTLTTAWSVWYLFSLLNIVRGNYSVLPLVGVLIGLVWHIHIALGPALIAIPISVILSKKLPKVKQVCFFLITLFVSSAPLIFFELRHNFIQTVSLIKNFSQDHGGGMGFAKLDMVLDKMSKNISYLLFAPQSPPLILKNFIAGLLIFSILSLVKCKILKVKEAVVLFFWIGGVVLFFTFSTSLVTELYLSNLDTIFLLVTTLWIFVLYRLKNLGKLLTVVILTIILVKNFIFYTTTDIYHKGYKEKKAVVAYIANHAKENNFPCVAISYLTTPGENVGFRYFYWLSNLYVNPPGRGGPIYTIVIPDELSKDSIRAKYGHIGIIPPQDIPSKDEMELFCKGPNPNLVEPMFLFTN